MDRRTGRDNAVRLYASAVVLVVATTGFALALPGCATGTPRPVEFRPMQNGSYRGAFIDRADVQVNVEFTLEDGIVTAASFRHLRADDNYRLDNDQEPYRSVIMQYREALDYLVGKPLSRSLGDLYTPGEIVQTQVDGYSGATIRSSKIISAVRDGLNRGVYSF